MKRILFIMIISFGQKSFAQRANMETTILDVTSYVKKMFPNHDTGMTGNITHYRYDAVSHPVLHIIEEKDIILIICYRYDANGNLRERSSSVWTLDSSRRYWESKILTKDASKFKVLYSETVELILGEPKPKDNYQKTKLLIIGAFSFSGYLQYT